MARLFDGANDNVKMSVGACSLTGAFTCVIVCRLNAASASNYANLITVQGGATGPSQYGLEIESTSDGSQLQIQSGNTGFRTSTFTVGTADGWVLLAGGKASGTTTPRMHKYVYSSDTWTHQDAGGTLGNPASSAGGVVAFGEWEGGFDDFDGDIAAAAVFDRNLADAEVEQLAHSLQGWLAAAPVGMWVFDQAATGTAVNDWTGGGANQTSISGTAVATSSVPGLSYGQDIQTVSSSAAASGTDATATPAVVAAVATVPRPDINIAAGPAVTAATAALPRPNVNVTAAPSVVATAAALPRPDVNITVVPTTVSAVVAIPTPTVLAGGNATATPATVTAVAALPRPAVNIATGPAVVPVTVAVQQPNVNTSAGPTAVTATVAVARPGVNVAASPNAVTVPVALPAAAVNVAASPAVVPVVVSLPTPSVGGATAATPATVTATIAVPRPAITVSAGPTTVPVVVTLPLVSIPGQTAKATSTATVTAAVAAAAAVAALRGSDPTASASAASNPTVG